MSPNVKVHAWRFTLHLTFLKTIRVKKNNKKKKKTVAAVLQGITCAGGQREPNTVWTCSMRSSAKMLIGVKAVREMEPWRGQTRFTPKTHAKLDGDILFMMLSWDTWRGRRTGEREGTEKRHQQTGKVLQHSVWPAGGSGVSLLE